MKDDVLQRMRSHVAERVHLLGTVAGTTACELVADGDEIVVGSDPACDLPVVDPLMPARAFRLTRSKCHSGPGEDCKCYWTIESGAFARVYVNQQLVRRERLQYGDVVDSGCHRFVFTGADDASRNRRVQQNVADLCERLVSAHPVPPGFFRDSPLHRYRMRRRKAVSAVGVVVALLLALVVLVPREEVFESVVPPLEVQVADTTLLAQSVRSLESVERRAFDPTEPPPDSPELAEKPVTPPPDQAAQPRLQDLAKAQAPKLKEQPVELRPIEHLPLVAAESPTEARIERTVARLEPGAPETRRTLSEATLSSESVQLAAYKPAPDQARSLQPISTETPTARPDLPAASAGPQTWQLPILPPAPVQTASARVSRGPDALRGSDLPVRRLSVEEAAQAAALAGDTAALRSQAVAMPSAGPVTRAAVRDVLAALEKPKTDGSTPDPAKTFDRLAAYRASPVGFESFQGLRVPVVRMSEQLEQLNAASTSDAIAIDGSVSDQEISVSWKSGQFHNHAPGQPPPKADPPTYCYVGKTVQNGKPCLYIAFTCVDPDVSKIIARNGNTSELIRDDSIEVFLDVNCDRKDYFQFIANAKGAYWSGYYPRPMIEGTIQTRPQPWDAGATVKTSVSRDPGQWVCEILIPFDRLGGVPAKGSRWAVNFARNFRGQIEDWQLQTWFAVYDKNRNFHHPSLFGIFQW